MKKWLLIYNETYYPGSGVDDWIDTFETKEEAENAGKRMIEECGQGLIYPNGDDRYENFTIVNLEDWINGFHKSKKG